MSVVRTLAWCFHILEMSSIHTGEHTNNFLNPSAERSQTAKIALRFTERPLEATRSFQFVMNDSWSALPWKCDPEQMIRTFKTPVVFSGFGRGVARIFPEVRPTFSRSSSPPIPPHPKFRHFFTVPLLRVGLRVVSQSTFAVYEMTQPLKFLNSVGLLGSLTSSVYHYSAIKNQVCSTSDFSLQMTVFYRFLSHCFWPTKAPHIRVRTCEPCAQVATPLFSLLSPERSVSCSFAREFRMWSTQYFTSLLNERQHFLFTVSLSDSA